MLQEMQVSQAFHEEGDREKLQLEDGDKVIIIDGKPDHYYWKGQCLRTFQVGLFPRCVVTPLRRRQPDDIRFVMIISLQYEH